MKIPAIKLRYGTAEEADAAVEALEYALRALNAEQDLFIREAPSFTKVSGGGEADRYYASAWFGALPAADPTAPKKFMVSSSTPIAATYGAVAPSLEVAHAMIDLETFGTRAGCVVRSLGAVFFGPAGLGDTFYVNFRTEPQVERGLHIDPDTAAWWERQGADVKDALEEDQQAPEMALAKFNQWIGARTTFKNVRIWGNGANFDEPILAEGYRAFKLQQPWRYSNSRCFRTLRALHGGIERERAPLRPHHALDDAIAQALHAVKILNATRGWGSV